LHPIPEIKAIGLILLLLRRRKKRRNKGLILPEKQGNK
jgi:hypothetical protein